MSSPREEHEGQKLGPGSFERRRVVRTMPTGEIIVVSETIKEVYVDEFGKYIIDEKHTFATTRCGCAPHGPNDVRASVLALHGTRRNRTQRYH
jgi:hypothetical protein